MEGLITSVPKVRGPNIEPHNGAVLMAGEIFIVSFVILRLRSGREGGIVSPMKP